MKFKSLRPRFSLRTLFVLVTLASLPMAWAAYNLNWIRLRHQFLAEVHQPDLEGTPYSNDLAPWPLRMLGEDTWFARGLFVPSERAYEAAALFPEAEGFIFAPERAR
jgi:hypothetical protein